MVQLRQWQTWPSKNQGGKDQRDTLGPDGLFDCTEHFQYGSDLGDGSSLLMKDGY